MFSLRNFVNLTAKPNYFKGQTIDQVRAVKRWVAPTLRELLKRRKKMGPEALTPRSSYLEWNYNAELYAFGKRLNEKFDLEKLQTAFIHRSYVVQEEFKQRNVGIEEPVVNLEDNKKLLERGEELISGYVQAYLKFSLPKLPEEGINAIYKYLISEDTLALVSSHLGTNDLVLCGDFPASKGTLRDTLVAVIGALEESSGDIRAYTFIRDFICTQLNQKDLMEVWFIDKPFERLHNYCKENNLGEPEPRIIGEVGKNTVLAAYHVGMYSNKKLIGKGFGESVHIAIDMAATDALRTFYGIQENMKPFDFNIEIERILNMKQKLLKCHDK